MLSLIGLCVWMQFHPRAYSAPNVLLLIVGILIFRQLSDAVLNAENNAFPMKFDWLLYLLDRNLGVSALAAARLFAAWQLPLLA